MSIELKKFKLLKSFALYRILVATAYNIAPCLVPTYTPRLPYDSKGGTECFWENTSSYNTCYKI